MVLLFMLVLFLLFGVVRAGVVFALVGGVGVDAVVAVLVFRSCCCRCTCCGYDGCRRLNLRPTLAGVSRVRSGSRVGEKKIKVSVMRVLTLLLGHELDGQIDEVLRLAEAYDEDENAFRFRYKTPHLGQCNI